MSTAKLQNLMNAAKRIFRVEGCYLYDEPEIAGVDKWTVLRSYHEATEKLSEKEREKYLAEIGTGSENEDYAIEMLHHDSSPELLNALLRCLPNNTIKAPVALLKFQNDSRVLPALANAYQLVALDNLGNIPWAINRIGAVETAQILRTRLSELVNNPAIFDNSNFPNFAAQYLATVAADILIYDPTDQDALTLLLEHPLTIVRYGMLGNLVMQLGKIAGTDFPLIFEEAKERVKTMPLPTDFTPIEEWMPSSEVLRTLAEKCPEQMLKQLQTYLQSEDETLRFWGQSYLWQLPDPFQPEARKILLAYLLEGKTSLDITCYFTELLGDLVPQGFLANSLAKEADLIRKMLDDESPSERLSAMQLLTHLDQNLAKTLATDALKDEPDSFLRNKLLRIIQS